MTDHHMFLKLFFFGNLHLADYTIAGRLIDVHSNVLCVNVHPSELCKWNTGLKFK